MKNVKLYRVQGRRVEFGMTVELGSASLDFFVVSKEMKYEAACEARYPSKYSRHLVSLYAPCSKRNRGGAALVAPDVRGIRRGSDVFPPTFHIGGWMRA
jgi:hypothetical protein